MTRAKKEARRETKRAYMARRRKRVRELFILHGFEPREIAARLIEDGTITASSFESAHTLVRSDVAEIRRQIDAHRVDDGAAVVAPNEIDALERRFTNLRKALALAESIAGDSETMTTSTSTLPSGDVMTHVRPMWPAGERRKANRDAVVIAEKIAEVELLLIEKRAEEKTIAGGGTEESGLTVIHSDQSIAQLIEANLVMGRFGQKKATG